LIEDFYWGIRKDASFLLSQGHEHAVLYPLCKLWSERAIASQRVNRNMKTEITLLQSAMSSVVTGKPGRLKRALENLDDGE